MIIKVCIGSACHLKGSYEVIRGLEKYIDENNLGNDIVLKSSFCLGQCSQAVSVEVDGGEIMSVSPAQVTQVMDELLRGD